MHRDFIAWQRETGQRAREPLERALAAAEAGDAESCGPAARQAAIVFLRAYLELATGEHKSESDDVKALLEAAIHRDAHFARVRPEAELLEQAGQVRSEADCESILDAMKEIRSLSGARGGRALGFSNRSPDADPCMEQLVVHSTTAERAVSIFAHGRLYTHRECVRRGLLSGPAPGAKHLLDPRRCTEFVIFGIPHHKYYAGEKVANAHRKGWIDEGLEEDYEASVRLFFHREELEALPGYEDDGFHELMVRDSVSLEHLAYAVFPSPAQRELALAAVTNPARREQLRRRCLVAPAGCCAEPAAYVTATNTLVADFVRGRT